MYCNSINLIQLLLVYNWGSGDIMRRSQCSFNSWRARCRFFYLQDVIFSDEAKIQSHQNRKLHVYYKKGEKPARTPKPKNPYSVMVWGGISKRGATKLVIFSGNMKSPFYQQHVLNDALLPFIGQKYPQGHKFMQDNAPCHTSGPTQQFMEANNINWWKTPPESPDLNPIEKLWTELKNHCAMVTTKRDLIEAIKEFWRGLTPRRCTRYINHIHKVIPEVIKQEGGSTQNEWIRSLSSQTITGKLTLTLLGFMKTLCWKYFIEFVGMFYGAKLIHACSLTWILVLNAEKCIECMHCIKNWNIFEECSNTQNELPMFFNSTPTSIHIEWVGVKTSINLAIIFCLRKRMVKQYVKNVQCCNKFGNHLN